MHYGEIWPMIMEKAWAKLVGTYGAIEGGSNWWTMIHMTNDPVERVVMRDEGYTGSNAKGLALWDNLTNWNAKEYMMFTGSDSSSYITNHAFAVLKATVLTMNSQEVKMVQMRNPWKGDDGWTGDYSKTKGGEKWEQLGAALEAQGGV